MNFYTNSTIVEKFLRKGRWHVRIKIDEKIRTMPQANYIWLKGNPAFNEIPQGYVVHHLDLDPLNDDISNLAIMAKYHHTAYHWKHKNIETSIGIDEQNGIPISKPVIGKNRNTYCLRYTVILPNGQKSERRLYNTGKYGENFKTKDEAEAAISKLWPGIKWGLDSN